MVPAQFYSAAHYLDGRYITRGEVANHILQELVSQSTSLAAGRKTRPKVPV